MKKTILYIASLLIAAVGFSACDDDKAIPPMPIPGEGVDIPEANTTILELKQAFYNSTTNNYATEVGEKEDGVHYIIRGTVVSSDETGNIYKNIMIQDGTAGLTISVNQSDLYESYKIGQQLTVDVTGLYMGAYGNCMQLGTEPASGKAYPGRIEEDDFTAHAWAYGIPAAVEPEVVTVEQVQEIYNNRSTDPDAFLAMQSRYVKFEDMEFENPGEPLAVQGSSTSRYAVDTLGNKLQLYNSGYSDIWANTLPWGKGNLVGILSFYSREWQLLLIDMNAFQGFVDDGNHPESVFSETFASGAGTFDIVNEELDGLTYVWSYSSNYSCMIASAYANGSNHASSARLVSPEIDLTGYSTATASFEQACNYFSSVDTAKQEATFEVMVDGGEWEALEEPNFPSSLSWTFASTGSIDLSKYAGKKIQVSFHYTSTASKAGSWEVKNLKISATK
jgi:hypothetical protein